MENIKNKYQAGEKTEAGKQEGAAQLQNQPAGNPAASSYASKESGYGAAGAAKERYPDRQGQFEAQAGETYEKAKETVNDAWNRASQGMNETYEHALEYGREHPGAMTLIAFGAGVTVGMLLAGGVAPRKRSRRLVPPVMNALTQIAREFIR